MRHHTIITGTGRSGTTFLVRLLSALGANTGFRADDPGFPNCDAGLECDYRAHNAPYIIKSPWLCDELSEWIDTYGIHVDRALVPVRDLRDAAASRVRVERETVGPVPGAPPYLTPGGLWGTPCPDGQREALCVRLARLVVELTRRDIPVTFLYFPRMVHDSAYLYEKLGVLSGGDCNKFLDAFSSVARPELIHDFGGTR